MKCPACGAAELVADCRPITAIIKGQPITVPDVRGAFCPACGEGVLDRENGDRYGEALALHRKSHEH
jgi:HTH-type transcriptional regulator/antitoxin MqsA